jgi:hypothetical protein
VLTADICKRRFANKVTSWTFDQAEECAASVRLSKDPRANRVRAPHLIDKVTLRIGGSCCNDRTSRKRETATGLFRSVLQGNASYVKAVRFSLDGH